MSDSLDLLKIQGYASSLSATRSLLCLGVHMRDTPLCHQIMARAAFIGNLQVVQYLVSTGIGQDAINQAAISGSKGNYTTVMKYFNTLQLTVDTRRKILLESARQDNADIAEVYIRHGIDKETINEAIKIAYMQKHMPYIQRIRTVALQCIPDAKQPNEFVENLRRKIAAKASSQQNTVNATMQSIQPTAKNQPAPIPKQSVQTKDIEFCNGMKIDKNGCLFDVSPFATTIHIPKHVQSVEKNAFANANPDLRIYMDSHSALFSSFALRDDLSYLCVIDDKSQLSGSKSIQEDCPDIDK